MTELETAVTLLVKVTVVLSLGLLFVRLAARQSAAFRHVVASTTIAAAALVPVAAAWLPPISLVLRTSEYHESVALTTAASPAPATTSPADREPGATLSTVLLIGWAAGAGVCLLPLLAVAYQSHRIRRQGQVVGVREATVPTLRGRRRCEIPVLLHAALVSPVVCGIFRPVIALPLSSGAWSRHDSQRALAHEEAHLRRGDVLVQVMARLVCAAYWFHPLVWVCWRRLRLEAERACDDAVLTTFEAPDYAWQLVRVARGVTDNLASSVLPTMTRRGELAVRVEAILDDSLRRSAPSLGGALPATLLGAAAAAWLACVTPTTAYVVRGSSSPAARLATASIRESSATETMSLVRHPDGLVRITAATVHVLLRLAYGVQTPEIVDSPDWTTSARFDIEATPAGPVSPDATVSMLRVLLAERFGLRVTRESRLQQVVLVDLPAATGGLLPPTRCTSTPSSSATRLPASLPSCGFRVAPGQIEATAVDAEALAATLSTAFGDRVIVEGADGGRFDMRLRWLPGAGNASSLMEALRTQAGATVSARQRLMPVLRIQSVHRPT